MLKKIGLYFATKLAVLIDFSTFLFKRAKNDAVLRVAASLSYTSLLAIVPLFAIGMAIFAAFPMFADAKGQLQEFIIHNFLPEMGEEVSRYFNDFINASAKLGTIGVVGIAVTSVLLLSTIESTFNFLFKVQKPRRFTTKMTMYWTIITLGPLLMGAAFSLRGYLTVIYKAVPEHLNTFSYYITNLVPTLITTLLLVAVYVLVPNKKIKIIHAFAGAVVTLILFAVLKLGFSQVILNSGTYKTLYGAMATIPILLVWLYASWATILYGAVVTAALEAYTSHDEENQHHHKPRENRRNYNNRRQDDRPRKNYEK